MLRRLTGRSDGARAQKGQKRLEEEEKKRKEEERKRVQEAKERELRQKEAERVEQEERKAREKNERERHEEDQRRRGAIMDVVESTAQVVDFAQGTMGLVDRLEAHPAGKALKNTVISNEPPPDRELNIQRLRTFKPQNDFAKMSLHDVPPVELSREFIEFPITDAMTRTQFEELKDYILISDVFFHYVPMDSFYSRSAPVIFQINDFRKVDNTCMRRYPLSNTGGYNILMSLDYCVAKKDLHHLSYSVSTSLNTFRKGASWGAVKVVLTLSHMDFPVKSNIQETMGVLHLADSDLQEYISDPRHSDGVITPQALNLLRGHYKRGEIENINLPRDDSMEVNTAKTVLGEDNGSVDVRDLMYEMKQKALTRAREGTHMDGHISKKSSMKKHKRVETVSSISDDDELKDPPEVEVGSQTVESHSDDTMEMPKRSDSPPRGVRAVNFG